VNQSRPRPANRSSRMSHVDLAPTFSSHNIRNDQLVALTNLCARQGALAGQPANIEYWNGSVNAWQPAPLPLDPPLRFAESYKREGPVACRYRGTRSGRQGHELTVGLAVWCSSPCSNPAENRKTRALKGLLGVTRDDA